MPRNVSQRSVRGQRNFSLKVVSFIYPSSRRGTGIKAYGKQTIGFSDKDCTAACCNTDTLGRLI